MNILNSSILLLSLNFTTQCRLLTLFLLMTTQEAFVDSVHQDQTARNVQSDL